MTFDEMEALTQRMANDFDQLGTAGVDVASFGPDLRRHLVAVGVRRDVARAGQVMHCRYGAQVFVFIDTRRLVPSDSPLPAAGVCGQATGRYAVVDINPDVPAPRCQTVRPDQQLEVRNTSNAFGQRGHAVTVTWRPYPPRRLAVGQSTVFGGRFGSYLTPGVHDVHLSLFPGSGGAEIWLQQN